MRKNFCEIQLNSGANFFGDGTIFYPIFLNRWGMLRTTFANRIIH